MQDHNHPANWGGLLEETRFFLLLDLKLLISEEVCVHSDTGEVRAAICGVYVIDGAYYVEGRTLLDAQVQRAEANAKGEQRGEIQQHIIRKNVHICISQ